MRLVRIDKLAPGGADLELHPRLTVVSGASPELRRRLLQTVRSVVDGDDPECTGLIEVSGVHLALDRATLDRLRLDRCIDPVLTLAEPAGGPTPPPASSPGPPANLLSDAPPGPTGADPTTPGHGFSPRAPHADPFAGLTSVTTEPPSQWVASTVVPDPDRADLRDELRAVTTERTALGERMEATRQHLDSFSRASLDVCRGQIDALEARRSTLRRQWEDQLEARRTRRGELQQELVQQRAALSGIGNTDPSAVAAAREQLAVALEVPDRVDPAALDLAGRLETQLRRVLEANAGRASVESRLGQAGEELVRAREELAEAERLVGPTGFDPSVVRRLEQVREEIFSEDDRSVRLGSARGKRRIQELRAEEAVLLDRLGFDTYSAYVMGIPSVRADLERSERLEAARERVAAAEARLGSLQAAASTEPSSAALEAELSSLVASAETLLGSPPADPSPWVPRDAGAPTSPLEGHLEQLQLRVERLADQLRSHRATPPGAESPTVREAMRALATALDAAGVDTSTIGNTGPAAPRALLHAADRWLAGAQDRAVAAADVRRRIEELGDELASIHAVAEPERDVSQWAQVEAELDAALDRLAEAEERVRIHDEAMDRLADLRNEELALRERERTLLAQISTQSAAPSERRVGDPFRVERPAGPPEPPPFHGVAPRADLAAAPARPGASPFETPPTPPAAPPSDPHEAPGAGGGADSEIDPHWRVVSCLAEQRQVSFAGSVPLVVDGLPDAAEQRDRVLERIGAMSDLIQVVVLSDDVAARAWADRLGHEAASLRV